MSSPTKPPPKPPKPPPPISAMSTFTPQTELAPLDTGKPERVPPRIIINAVEGFGKTSIMAYAPNPVILMAAGETGYETLLGARLVPDVPRTIVRTWPELLNRVDWLADQKFETVGLDALGGMERLCHEHVCQRDFKNDWGEKGFLSYNKGFVVSVNDWLQLLVKLDRLRENGTTIVIASHAAIKPFRNPLGEDYDQYKADAHDKTWGVTAKWADAILFGNFLAVIETDRPGAKKGKGIGGNQRIIYTEHHDAYDAKNRYGMPSVITLTDNPAESWNIIWSAIQQNGGNNAAT